MSWEETTLGRHLDIVSGPAFKSERFTEEISDVPLIKGENIAQGCIDWGKSKYWPRDELDEYMRYWLQPSDVVLAMDRPWIPSGLKWSEIKEHDPLCLLVQRVARLRAKNGLHQSYLKHIIGSKSFSDYIRNIMYGVNVPHISGKQIGAYSLFLPDLQSQIRIASVLSAYDMLIENNRRRIALLEESSRLLYREWFVHLRFPGHEHAKIIEALPEGWSFEPFSDLADFLNGFAFKPHHLGEVGIPIVKIPELKNGTSGKTPRYDGDDIPSKYLLNDGDLIFSWSGTLAVDFWISGNAWLNQHLFKVTPTSRVSAAFLLLALREAMPQFMNHSVGATMKHIRRSALSDVGVLLPKEDLLNDFQSIANQNYRQIGVLKQQNIKLAEARELLLPRLMDGRIEV